ncbi:putative quinol monooxygenase [Chloroflexota bacterium]
MALRVQPSESSSWSIGAISQHNGGGSYMGILILLEAQAKPADISDVKSYMAEIIPDTRTYDGCQKIDVYFNTEHTDSMVAVEHWDSRAHYEKYLTWRKETGVLDKLDAMLAGPPSIRYFERIDT